MNPFKRHFSALLAALIIFSSVPFSAFSTSAGTSEELFAVIEKADETLKCTEQLDTEESGETGTGSVETGSTGTGSSEELLENPEYHTIHAVTDDNGKTVHYEDSEGNVVSLDVEQKNTVKAVNYPSSYDARDDGIVTSVKNQNPYGTCWAFAAIGNMETYLLKNGMASSSSLDLSENHLVWFSKYQRTTDTNDRTYGDGENASSKITAYIEGGNWHYEVSALTRGSGPVSEIVSPYVSDADESLRYVREYSVENFIYVEYPTQAQIKENILTYGSVYATYYSTDDGYGDGNFYDPSNICAVANHAVLIVGWDDNYSASNFKNTPASDGAWLVKNSWGTSGPYMTDGYFWLSYCDLSLNMIENITLTEAVDNIYQYECTGAEEGVTYEENTIKGANVYTADSNETIKAVGFYALQKGSGCRVRILKLDSVSDTPDMGTVASEQRCTLDFNGYITVTLDTPVFVSEGEAFAVEVTITTPGTEDAYIYSESPGNSTHNLSYISNGDAYSWESYTKADLCIKATSDKVTLDIWDGTAAESFESGTGTEADPYIIKTAEQLAYLASSVSSGATYEGKYIKLANDIYLNYTEDPENRDTTAHANMWTPIGTSSAYFCGTFDGDGHAVYGMYTDSSGNYQGLFGYSEGTLKNVGIEQSNIYGATYTAGVCAVNSGAITGCYNAGTVSGDNETGGVCGWNNGTVTNSYNTGAVSGISSVGGVCGLNSGTVTNSYNAGTVSGISATGGVCGTDDHGTMTDCYYFAGCARDGNSIAQNGIGNEIQGQATADVTGKTTGLTEEQMKQQSSFAGFDFNTVWAMPPENSGYKYPVLYDCHIHVFASESVIEPTCTEQGYTKHTCFCGYEVTDTYVNALGHDFNITCEWNENQCRATGVCSRDNSHVETETAAVIYVKDTDAGCTTNEKGHYEATFTNSVFGKQTTDENSVEKSGTALNHNWGTPAYSWDGDKCTATRVCANDPNHKETETVTGTFVKETDATCTANEKGHYEATFVNPVFENQTGAPNSAEKAGTALNHDWGTASYSWNGDKCTATHVCARDNSHTETETVTRKYVKDTDATCTTNEKGHYEAIFVNSSFETQATAANGLEMSGTALRHNWDTATYEWSGDRCTATRVCSNDTSHIQIETVTGTYVKDTDATCTTNELGHYEATFVNSAFKKQVTETDSVEKSGTALNHSYGNPVYSWDGDKCTATRVCVNNSDHKETETVTGVYVKDNDAGCTTNEKGHYEATFVNSAFSKQMTAANSAEKSGTALSHSWGTPAYSWDGDKCTATRVCVNDSNHKETETVTGVYVKDTDASCTANEKGHYEAIFENSAFAKQTTAENSVEKSDTALNHSWDTPAYSWNGDECTATRVCTRDNSHTETETVTGTYVKDSDASCTANEKGHYEATFVNSAFAKQTTAENSVEKSDTALNHNWDTPAYSWDGDECTATRVCTRDNSHTETETVTGTYVKDTDANFRTNEKGHYEATFVNSAFEKQATAANSVETPGTKLNSYVLLKNTEFVTAWGKEFTTEITATQTIGEGISAVLTYDKLAVTLKTCTAADGVTVSVDGNKITLTSENAIGEDETVVTLTFITSSELAAGEWDFLSCDDKNTSSFGKLRIYYMGDVNMDGQVNSRDALLVKQYAVRMVTLTEVQLVYADVYTDGKVNSRDGLLISQSAVHMDVTLGDRVSVSFVTDSVTVVRSVRSGSTVTQLPELPDGYVWSASVSSFIAPDYAGINAETHFYARKVS